MNCAGHTDGAGESPAGGAALEEALAAQTAAVHDIVALRIARALKSRTRYRYVTPQVRREGEGWAIESPNCSRHVDPTGGPIVIAWFEPQGSLWALYARHHRLQQWQQIGSGLTLTEALAQVCQDPLGKFWP